MDKPKRKVVIEAKIEADSWAEAADAFNAISERIDREGPITQLISGGWSSGYSVTGRESPQQTGDNYREQNAEYVARLKRERT